MCYSRGKMHTCKPERLIGRRKINEGLMDSKPKANLIISNNTYNIRYSSVHKSWMVMEINVVNFYDTFL